MDGKIQIEEKFPVQILLGFYGEGELLPAKTRPRTKSEVTLLGNFVDSLTFETQQVKADVSNAAIS